jgi:hypothetical protein
VLTRGVARQIGLLGHPELGGYCVTGLPASWAHDLDEAHLLGARLRAGYPYYSGIRVIVEPLGLIYALTLDNDGEIVGDAKLRTEGGGDRLGPSHA